MKIIVFVTLSFMFGNAVPSLVCAGDSGGEGALAKNQDAPWSSPIGLFRKFISPADGDRCPMYPTCSRYAGQAFAQEGLLKGWILTCDRLLRCGRDETRFAPKIRVQGTFLTYDPLDANTFWWKKR